MEHAALFETDENQIEKIVGMSDEYPYCMHRRDLTEFVVPWHWHEELELGYLAYGTSVIQTLNAEYPIHAGEGFFINSNVMDMKRNGEPGRPVCEINHIFHPVLLGGHFRSRFETKYLNPILKKQMLEVYVIRPDHETGKRLLQLLRDLQTLQGQPDTEFQTRNLLSAAWLLLLDEIRNYFVQPPRAAVDYQNRMRSMLSYIHLHYPEKIVVADIAGSANISEREALRCFQKALKTTPSDYLLKYRIDRARKLLLETADAVTEIGYRVGFFDTAYFGKVFKRFCGATPTQYRRMHAQGADEAD